MRNHTGEMMSYSCIQMYAGIAIQATKYYWSCWKGRQDYLNAQKKGNYILFWLAPRQGRTFGFVIKKNQSSPRGTWMVCAMTTMPSFEIDVYGSTNTSTGLWRHSETLSWHSVTCHLYRSASEATSKSMGVSDQDKSETPLAELECGLLVVGTDRATYWY